MDDKIYRGPGHPVGAHFHSGPKGERGLPGVSPKVDMTYNEDDGTVVFTVTDGYGQREQTAPMAELMDDWMEHDSYEVLKQWMDTHSDAEWWVDENHGLHLSNVPPDADDRIVDAVDDWLDDHPEATTTVEAGSVTVAKFHSSVVDSTLTQSGHPADAAAVGATAEGLDDRLQLLEDGAPEIISDATQDWLDDHVTPTGSAVIVDNSLTQSGAAADAKVTGDNIANLKSDLSDMVGDLSESLSTTTTLENQVGLIGFITSEGTTIKASRSVEFTGRNLKDFMGAIETDGVYPTTSNSIPARNFWANSSSSVVALINELPAGQYSFIFRFYIESENPNYDGTSNTIARVILKHGTGTITTGDIDIKSRSVGDVVELSKTITITEQQAGTFENAWMYFGNTTNATSKWLARIDGIQFEIGDATEYKSFRSARGTSVNALDKKMSAYSDGSFSLEYYISNNVLADLTLLKNSARLAKTLSIKNWQNGTIPNAGNPRAVRTADFISVLPEDIVTVSINKEIADDEVFSVGGAFYNSSYTAVLQWDTGIANTEKAFKAPRNAAFVKFSLERVKINSAAGTPLRASDMVESDVTIIFDNYESATNRNEDILPMVDAAVNRRFNRECFSAIVCTDLHGDIGRTSAWMHYLNNSDIVNVGICLGDIANSYYTDTDGTWYTNIVKDAVKNVYTVIGNHDNWKATGTGNSFTKWLQPTLTQIGISDLTTPYYAINRTDYPISIIVLDNYDHPSNSATASHGEIDTMSQRQIDWLITALSNVPSNNTLLIARHAVTAENTPVSCAFSQPNRTVSGNGSVYGTQPIIETIVNAWMTGTSVSESFAPIDEYNDYPTLTVSADFSSRGNGKFAGYAVGHTHADTISKITAFPNQNIFCFTTSSADMAQQQSADLPREPADKTIDAITVLAIDTTNRMVKLVRIGSNITTDMTDRKMIAIPY